MVSGFLALVVVILPIVSEAQVVGRTPRLCFVTFDRRDRDERFKPFFDGLRGLGYTDGQTITIDYLPADGAAERFPALAAECLHREADIIVVTTTPAAQAAKNATHTVPIVMVPLGDPVGTGLVASLARPGGNVTGLSFMAAGIAAKRLQLLKEAVPTIARVLVLSYLVDPIARPQVTELENAAHTKRGRKIVGGPDFPDDQFYSQRRGNGQSITGVAVCCARGGRFTLSKTPRRSDDGATTTGNPGNVGYDDCAPAVQLSVIIASG